MNETVTICRNNQFHKFTKHHIRQDIGCQTFIPSFIDSCIATPHKVLPYSAEYTGILIKNALLHCNGIAIINYLSNSVINEKDNHSISKSSLMFIEVANGWSKFICSI